MSVAFKKIKYKIKDISIQSLIKLSLFLNEPYLAAIAFWLATSIINPKCRSNYTVLCMGRSIFADDINAMATYSGQIRYVVIWRSYFQMIFHYFIKGQEENKLTEETYHRYDYCCEGKNKYRAYLNRVLPILQKLIGFKAIMSCNFGYLEQQELAMVCEENRLPLIVLNKEGIVIPSAYSHFVSQFKNRKFIGAKMLCYNNLIKKALLDLNLSGLTEDKTEVVGVPRLDCYFTDKIEIKSNQSKQIVLFSFFPEDKFRYLKLNPEQIREINKISERFHKLFIDFALRHPDCRVIIKTKAARHYVDYVKNLLRDGFKSDIPNLSITNEGDSFELINNSMAVAGFNSTTLIEAIIARKMILSPDFNQIVKDQARDYFEGYGELVNYVRDENDLEEYIFNGKKYILGDSDKKSKFLERFIFISDGRASQRAEEAIIKIINEHKNRSLNK